MGVFLSVVSEQIKRKKGHLEKEKYYYDHNYFTFYDWEENVIKIILMAA